MLKDDLINRDMLTLFFGGGFPLADAGGGRPAGHRSVPGPSPGGSREAAENLRPGQKEAAAQV